MKKEVQSLIAAAKDFARVTKSKSWRKVLEATIFNAAEDLKAQTVEMTPQTEQTCIQCKKVFVPVENEAACSEDCFYGHIYTGLVVRRK